MVASLGSTAAFIIGLAKVNHAMWISGLVAYFGFPIIFEMLINLKALLCKNSLRNHKCSHHHTITPLVYSPGYNITAGGLEKVHPFDSTKYRRIYDFLIKKKIID